MKTQTAADNSHLKFYKTLTSIRRTSKAWQDGDLDIRVLSKDSVLAFSRYAQFLKDRGQLHVFVLSPDLVMSIDR